MSHIEKKFKKLFKTTVVEVIKDKQDLSERFNELTNILNQELNQ